MRTSSTLGIWRYKKRGKEGREEGVEEDEDGGEGEGLEEEGGKELGFNRLMASEHDMRGGGVAWR